MLNHSEAPATRHGVAENEIRADRAPAQHFPTFADSPVSYLRNALLIIQLAGEFSQACRQAPPGSVLLQRQEAADVVNKIVAAIEAIQAADRALIPPAIVAELEKLATFRGALAEIEQTNLELERESKSWQEEG